MIRSATAADLPHIRRLWQENRHAFLACGLEDLPGLLGKGRTALGELPDGALWGFVGFDAPAPSPARGSLNDGALRAALVARSLPAGARLDQLVGQVIADLRATAQPFQLTALTRESWLLRALQSQGFPVTDHLCFYQRTRRSLPSPLAVAHTRALRPDDLSPLTALDRAAFPPLWRMDEAGLAELCLSSWVLVAEVEGRMAGYAALSLHPGEDGNGNNQAQLARLAVYPDFQGLGIGRQLLVESIAHAHAQNCYRILLNTPESNPASRRLYESLHFRRHGARVPVLLLQQAA